MSTVAIGQFSAGEDKTANLREIERLAQTAAENRAKMLFLPEYSMYYAKVNARSKNIEAAEPCDGAFIIALGEFCRRYGLWIAAGMYERTDGLPYNTIAVLDDRGSLRGTHRKNRLYDAFGYRESDECRAGDKPFSPIETPAGKLGIITCFELRFPALAAEQKARVTYDNILRLSDDPDVNDVIKFLRAREIVHFQRFGEGLRLAKEKLDEKNVYFVNPSFDR